MKVHQIIANYNLSQGGAQKIALQIHKYLLKNKNNSSLYGLTKNDVEFEMATSSQTLNVYSLKAFYYLLKYVKKNVKAKDVVHVHLFPTLLYVASIKFLGFLPKCKLIFTEHSTSNGRRGKTIGKIIDPFCYSKYDEIISISKATKESLELWIPMLKNKVKIIENGAYLEFKSFQERVDVEKKIILCVGRLTEAKNYENILKAIDEIKNENFELWIAGEGELKEKLYGLVKKLNLTEKVKFLGFVEDVSGLMSKAHIFLMPSKWEGFGLAALEAMNAGLPCVLSNIPGLGDLIKNNESGFLVNPKDINDISKKIKLLLDNYKLRSLIGKKAFEKSKNHNISFMIEKYISIYQI